MAATVSASSAASAGPSTVPHATPAWALAEPGWTKRAIRTEVKATDDRQRRCVGHNRGVSSPLARVPIAGRRRLAATLALFATLFVAVGAVAATGRGTAAAPVFAAVALTVAVGLALVAW